MDSLVSVPFVITESRNSQQLEGNVLFENTCYMVGQEASISRECVFWG